MVSTSRPTPTELADAYRAIGAPCIVSIHLSSALSGTVDAARAAAIEVAAAGIEVRVVDSATIAMGLGFAVIAAAAIVAEAMGSVGFDYAALEAPRMSLCWPLSLKIYGGSHRWSLGHHPLRLCASRSVGVA